MASLRLATFKVNGRVSYGAVTDTGIVDLGRKLAKYPTLLDVFRAGAIGEARAAATGPADHQLKGVELLPPILAPEKIICVGINYPERNAEYKDGREPPKYPNLFCRFPSSLVGSGVPIVRPKVSDKFDYEGEIVIVMGREGRHIPTDKALSYIGGLTLGNEGSIRDWLRHEPARRRAARAAVRALRQVSRSFRRHRSAGGRWRRADRPHRLLTRGDGAFRRRALSVRR